MAAYLLILVAVLSRIVPHAGWYSFTAVGGALLYFGARRSWREMLAPLAALIATDYFLTVFSYHYPFRADAYLPTWIWYVAAMVLGQILLSSRSTWLRFGAAVVLGPTSFFLLSNFAVWASSVIYPHTAGGLATCYIAGLPFYGNDVASTAIVAGLAFGIPVLVRRMSEARAAAQRA
jgi:hypothetical protein